jgi:hypothetical protein
MGWTGVTPPSMMAEVEPRGKAMPEIRQIAHVTLTVSDLSRTVPCYERLFETSFFWDGTPGPFRRVV